MLKITDLVDSENFVELQESEVKSNCGGDCYFSVTAYKPGESKYFNGGWNVCTDYPWYQGGDDWVRI